MTSYTLYSYRRCPYAMRARMALVVARIDCLVHEIDFKNKPAGMLAVSPKGTVPVLVVENGDVLEESLDIMFWALQKNDPKGWLKNQEEALALITENDGPFKGALDRYKYPNRFPDEDCTVARQEGLKFLLHLERVIAPKGQLCAAEITVADVAIFPFVRQFANVDRAWFDAQDLPALQNWLVGHLESDLFKAIFQKKKESVYNL